MEARWVLGRSKSGIIKPRWDKEQKEICEPCQGKSMPGPYNRAEYGLVEE